LVFGASGKIFNMMVKEYMDNVESEVVVRQANSNRPPSFSTTARQAEWTRIYANLGERDRLGRSGVRLAPRSGLEETTRDVFGETPNTATETVALPTHRISKDSRLFASIRGSMRKSFICRIGLTQVVDFHDFSGFFRSCGGHRRFGSCSPKFRFSLCKLLISMIVSDNSL